MRLIGNHLFYTKNLGLCADFKISKNYAVEIQLLSFPRSLRDGLTFLDAKLDLDLYKGDHKPSFQVELTVLNCYNMFQVYNVNHCDDQDYPVREVPEDYHTH